MLQRTCNQLDTCAFETRTRYALFWQCRQACLSRMLCSNQRQRAASETKVAYVRKLRVGVATRLVETVQAGWFHSPFHLSRHRPVFHLSHCGSIVGLHATCAGLRSCRGRSACKPLYIVDLLCAVCGSREDKKKPASSRWLAQFVPVQSVITQIPKKWGQPGDYVWTT